MKEKIIAFLIKRGLGWLFKKLEGLISYFFSNRKDEKLNKEVKEAVISAKTKEEFESAAQKVIDNFNKRPKP